MYVWGVVSDSCTSGEKMFYTGLGGWFFSTYQIIPCVCVLSVLCLFEVADL